MSKEFKFFTFPLAMVREIIIEGKQQGISYIIDYCITMQAKKEDRKAMNAIYRAIEDYLDSNRPTTTQLDNCINYVWEYYASQFADRMECNSMFIDGMGHKTNFAEFINNTSDDDLISKRNIIVKYGKISYAKDSLNIVGGDNVRNWADGLKMENKYPSGKAPFVSVATSTLFNFRDKSHTEDFILMYLAIRSQIGIRNEMCCTTSKAIKMRMVGAHNDDELTAALTNRSVKAFDDKINKRYQFDRVLNLLVKNDYVIKVPWKFGFKSRLFITCSIKYEQFPEAIKAFLEKMNSKKADIEIKDKEKALKDRLLSLISAL